MVKCIKFVLLAFLLTCNLNIEIDAQEKQINENSADLILKFANGLLPQNVIKGEAGYNILERMSFYNVPAVSVALIKDFKLEWVKTYGVKSKISNEPVNDSTVFQIASISKTLTAIAALSLAEKGELNIENSIDLYLKSWKLPQKSNLENVIKMKNLLSHSAAITPFGFNGYRTSNAIPDLIQILNGQKPANSKAISITGKAGAKYQYSGGGFLVAQLAMQDIKNTSFEEILKENIFSKLNLKQITSEQNLSEMFKNNFSSGHLVNGKNISGGYHIYPELSAAGIWSSSGDLAKILLEILKSYNDKASKMLSQESAKKMVVPYFSDNVGLGIFIEKRDSATYISHSGSNLGYKSFMIGNLEAGDGAVILTNGELGSELYMEILRSIAKTYNWKNFQPVENSVVDNNVKSFENFHGRYRQNGNKVFTIITKNESLFIKDIWGNENRSFQIAANKFITNNSKNEFSFSENNMDGELTLNIKNGGENIKLTKIEANHIQPIEYLFDGEFDKAVAEIKKELSKNPENQEFKWFSFDELAYEVIRTNNFEKAKMIFELNLKLNPEISVCYYGLGDYYLKTGDDEKALQYFIKTKEIIKKYPDSNKEFAGLSDRVDEQIMLLTNKY